MVKDHGEIRPPRAPAGDSQRARLSAGEAAVAAGLDPGPRPRGCPVTPGDVPSFWRAWTRDRLCSRRRRVGLPGGGARGFLADRTAAAAAAGEGPLDPRARAAR